MTMKVKDLVNYQARLKDFAAINADATKTEGEKAQAFSDAMAALGDDMQAEIAKQVEAKTSDLLNAQKSDPKMTQTEIDFFNEISTDVEWKDDKVIPETIVTKVFEDLTSEHPFLKLIGLTYTGIKLKVIRADAKGAAVWGKLFGDIKGQLDAAFTESAGDQSKLTVFVVLPNDMAEFGPAWTKQFVTTQITEAIAVAGETAFLTGDGKDKPIGLNRQVQKDVTVTGGVYPEKVSAGTLTLKDTNTAKKELAGIVKKLSVKENGKPIVARGKIVLVTAPGSSIDFEAAMTMQNVNGQWVNALPYGLQTCESVAVAEGKVIAFVMGRYDAFSAGPLTIKPFDQTLALEDATLYTAKQFFFGKAADNNAAQVYDLKTDTATTDPGEGGGDGKETQSTNINPDEEVAGESVDPSTLKVDEIKAKLTEVGIEFDPNAKKADLLALLPKTE
ncbi:phage major capsid protein [Latilactobacillus curvatus]|uniref:phage major capsid protein n=1 Tax=Latilactobacillus curvatus TaxID=28038 RepID=UPI00240EF6AA|nr:phage major capsid protein [Latilactobacillus curvatus]WEU69531.1 major capsid protein [Latilactobacillus phage TMW 1.1365 P2]